MLRNKTITMSIELGNAWQYIGHKDIDAKYSIKQCRHLLDGLSDAIEDNKKPANAKHIEKIQDLMYQISDLLDNIT